MVMFKARFEPMVPDKPRASDKPRAPQPRQQQQQQPQPDKEKVPPIEKERGPQYPVKEPGPAAPPERVKELVA